MQNCKKCGNPQKMFWCNECESSNESIHCYNCEKDVAVLDKEYHNGCSETQEQKVYLIECGSKKDIDDMTDKEIIKEAEGTGQVYSINGLIDELNSNELNTENYWFKLI